MLSTLMQQIGTHPFWAQLLLLLVIIYFGIRFGGVALGLLGGLGITLLAFLFGVAPGKPPIDVILIIIAVVTTSATLEATGALNLIVRLAEKLLRRHPERVTYLAPICTFSLTMLVGTGHAVYPLLPVIYDVAYSKGIRPERPMAIASVASQMALGALRSSDAMLSMAVSGIAGPDGGTTEKPVGTVCFGWALRWPPGTPEPLVLTETCHFSGDRADIRRQPAIHALRRAVQLLDQAQDQQPIVV